MPEPFPWDHRRDFRKQERSSSDPRFCGGGFAGGGGGLNRWREQPHHPAALPPHPPPFQQQRWFSDFRSPRPPPAEGQSKQGDWHVYSDDAGQGFVPRYADRNLEDENCRPFVSRGNGRYIRNNRENRNPFTRKDWKAPTWEPAKSPSARAKPIADVSNLISVGNTQQCSSRGNSFPSDVPPNSVNLSEQSLSQPLVKEKNNKNGGTVDETTAARLDSGKENCMKSVDWKPPKLARMGGLPSRGSSNSMGVVPTNMVAEVQPKNETAVQSPAADAWVRSTSPVLSDDSGSRRKRRLGWGEGLAKYEKKRVEDPEDGIFKNELIVGVYNTETTQFESVNPPEKSPRVTSLSDCASPGTPSSVACSSSLVIEEKGLVNEADVDRDTTNLSCSPSIAPKIHYCAPTFNLKNVDLASIANLSLLINDLLQKDNRTSAETGYAMSKLLVWKVDMLRALEVTESELESLETELKSLIAETENFCSLGPSWLPGEEQLKPCEELVTVSKCGIRLVPLQVNSSEEMIAENAHVGPEDVHVLLKDEEIDSPGSATSGTEEVTEGSMNLNVDSSRNFDDNCLKNGLSQEENSEYVENHVLTVTNFEDNVYDSILSSNRDAARKCMEQLNKFLPEHLHSKRSIESSISSLQSDPSVVKTKILTRKRFLQFKEKVLTIKFKAFRHFWKEGRVVSIRKLRGKTRKKFDPSRNGHKRNNTLHSRVYSNARGPHIVPANEVIELVNGLLSEFAFKPHGSTLKMPSLILDKNVKMSRFISNNGLVEDPCSLEKERCMLNPWTSEEKEMFVDKLAAFGKDFGKIASFLESRSVADCIEFYYKNHKSKCFEKIKKNPATSNQIKSPSKTYLVASGKRRNPEFNASSLDILGAASEIVANIDNGIISIGGDGLLQGSDTTNRDSEERETEAADVLASICGSLSSEGVSSCITSSVDNGYQDHGPTEQPLTPDDDDEMSDESCGEMDTTDWSDEETSIFVQAMLFYGKDFVMVSQSVGTRSVDQCKLFFSKARKCLKLDQIQPGGEETALVDDNGGDSDIEDGCTVETGSVIRDNDSECSMEENLPPPDMKLNHDVAGPQNLRPDFEISKDSSKVRTGTVVVSSCMESEQGVKEEDDCCMRDGSNEAENKAVVEVSGLSLPEGNSDNKIVEDISGVVSEAKFEPQPLANVSWPSTDDCQQHLPPSDSIVFSQVLWGYPVSVQTMKEIIEDVKCEIPTARPDVPEQKRNLSSDQFFMKCNGSRQLSKAVEAPFPSLGGSRDQSRPRSAGEGSSKNGDVKLFGTILNSSQQKTNNFVQRTSGNNRQDHKESLILNLGAHQMANIDSVQSKFEHHVPYQTANLDSVQSKFERNVPHQTTNLDSVQSKFERHVPHQTANLDSVQSKFEHNVPVGSVSFWDGNRIRTGVPPLPDSALLLAKYPAAFTNYVKLDQPGFPHREASSSNGPRYPELQPFTIGMNQRQDGMFNEVRRRNSFDLVPGMANVVGRGGVFAGGQGLGLSDPVTAIKMHYDAKIEQLKMKGGNLIKEVDKWISSRGGGM